MATNTAPKLEPKDRIYKLKNGSPLSFIISGRGSADSPLLYWDETKQENREIRWSRNQKSPFVDEQDSQVQVSPIIFEDGMLQVVRTEPVLQQFLSIHPLYDISFEEVDLVKDADVELEKMELEENAMSAARNLSSDQIESLVRVLLNVNPDSLSSSIMKRDIKRYARNFPKEFLAQMDDPELLHNANIRSFFDNKLLGFRNNDTSVHFNLPNNKTRMMEIPLGADKYSAVADFLQSDNGIEILKMLEIASEGL